MALARTFVDLLPLEFAPRPRKPAWLRVLANRRVLVGGGVIIALYLVALLAPLIAPSDPTAQVLLQRLKPPSAAHLMGTDSLGRDILSRAIWGARASLAVSLAAMALSMALGSLVGIVAGFRGGWLDDVLMRIADVFIAFPPFILVITLVAIFGNSLLLLIVFLSVTAWPSTARLVRAEVLSLREREFVLSAHVAGAGPWRIMLRHILPGVVPVMVVTATLRVAVVILVEAALSYFGLGVQPPAPTWGNMVADGRGYLDTAPWIAAFPGAFVVITVMAYNVLGEGLQSVLDPQRVRD